MAREQPRIDGDAGSWLWRAGNAWVRRMRRALAPHDLTHAQFLLLAGMAWLEDRDRGERRVTQQRLAALTGVDVTAASTVIRALATAGLIGRVTGADARARELTLTSAGRARHQAAAREVDTAAGEFFAPLGTNLGLFTEALRALTGVRTRITAPTRRSPATPARRR